MGKIFRIVILPIVIGFLAWKIFTVNTTPITEQISLDKIVTAYEMQKSVFLDLSEKISDASQLALENLTNAGLTAGEKSETSTKLIAVTLEKVIDGDTIWVMLNEQSVKVRFIGIDTPESVHLDKNRNNEYGTMASDYTKALLKDVTILYLQYDTDHEDVYGRQLCYVWLREDVDTNDMQDVANYMLNAILVRNGYAYNKVYMPNCMYADFFEQLREEAQESKAGLWIYDDFADLWS